MSISMWNNAFTSVAGTSHVKEGLPCQDFSDCMCINSAQDGEVLIAVASDGAGSAKYSREGANTICMIAIVTIQDFLKQGHAVAEIDSDFGLGIIRLFKEHLALRVKSERDNPRDFACTFLLAVIGEHDSVFFQIGDGAIVINEVGKIDSYSVVFWPQKGEYANNTNFITDENAEVYLQYKMIKGQIDKVAVFTDGLERIALQLAAHQPHAPFFEYFFKLLSSVSDREDKEKELILNKVVCEKEITSRSDDDLTLIIAMHRGDTAHEQPADGC